MTNSINLLAISYSETDNVVVPEHLVAFVFPYAPLFPLAFKKEAFVGAIIYENAKTPIIDLTKIDHQTEKKRQTDVNNSPRIVILTSINPDSAYEHYGIIAQNPPEHIYIGEENIIEEPEELGETPPLFYNKIKITLEKKNMSAYVLDIEKLESTLLLKK